MDIDVVYTWVDPNDKQWVKQRNEYKEGAEEAVERLPLTNIDGNSELYYSLLSLTKYAPWIRKVWIVCQRPQRPSFLNEFDLNVDVVFHDEIFPDPSVLPTFNSYAIECCLHRIPGLAEQFIYFNDDMMFGAPVEPNLFFDKWGSPKVYIESEWNPKFQAAIRENDSGIPYTASCKLIRRLLNEKYDYDSSRGRIIHQATALTRTCMIVAERTFSTLWNKCVGARFRRGDDIIPVPLAVLNGVEINLCVKGLRNPSYLWTPLSKVLKDNHAMFQKLSKSRPKFICINDVNPSFPSEIIFHYFGCLDVYFS